MNPSGVFNWDVETGEQISTFDYAFAAAAFGNISWMAMPSDGRSLVFSTENGEIQTRNLATWAEINRFRAHIGLVRPVMFTPDAHGLLSAADDGVRLWSLESGAFLQNYEPPPIPDGALLPPNVRNVASYLTVIPSSASLEMVRFYGVIWRAVKSFKIFSNRLALKDYFKPGEWM
jgi:WD40 repeat protein